MILTWLLWRGLTATTTVGLSFLSSFFLQSECSDGERRRFDVYLASNTRSNTFFVHYLNNYNFRMAFFRGDGMSLEAKLVVQLEEDAGRRLVKRPSAQQKYSLPEVIVSLFPLPNLFD